MRYGAIVLFLALTCVSGRAAADARTADILMRECQRHFNSMQYGLAASKCEAALKADPTVVGAMRYLAVIYRALGKRTGNKRHFSACIAWAEMYLRERPKSRFVDRLRDEINTCRKALGERELPKVQTQGETGALVITCDIDGAGVTVDDMRRGATPLTPVQVTPGRHTITVYKYGYLPFTTTVEVVPKQILEVKVELTRDPNAPLRKPPDQPPGPDQPAIQKGVVRVDCEVSDIRVYVNGKVQQLSADNSFESEAGIHAVRVEADGYDSWERRVAVVRGQARELKVTLRHYSERARARKWAWALTATAAVTAGVGIYFGMAESASYDKAHELYQEGRRGIVTPDLRAQIANYRSQGDRQLIIASVSIGVALAALGGAVYLWIRERGDERPVGEPPALALRPVPLPGGGGLVLTRGFGP